MDAGDAPGARSSACTAIAPRAGSSAQRRLRGSSQSSRRRPRMRADRGGPPPDLFRLREQARQPAFEGRAGKRVRGSPARAASRADGTRAQLPALHRNTRWKEIPFIVAGVVGFSARLHTLSKAFQSAKLPVRMTGSDGTLERFCDNQHGYLRLTVTEKKLTCDYIAVPDPSHPKTQALQAFDSVDVNVP